MAVAVPDERAEPDGPRSEGRRDTGLRANWRVIAFTFYIGMSLFEYGYDKGAIAGFQAMPGFLEVFGYQAPDGTWAIEPDTQQIITSLMTVGSFVGALATGPIGAYLNRRYSIMLAAVFLIAAVVIMAVTTSFSVLYFARFLCGLGNGVVMNFAFLYLQEITPPHLRSLCFGMASFWITFGTTIGMVVNNATQGIAGRHAYQIPLYVCFPVPALLILSLPFMPESPRWLLHNYRPEEALRSLRFFRGGAYDEIALLQEFEEMKVIAEREAKTEKDWRLMLELFRGPNLRRTIVCVGVTSVNSGVGAMFILSFGTYFFSIADVGDPFKWIIITNCVGLVGLFFSWFVVARIGHRRLILAGAALCTLSMVVIGALYSVPSLSSQQAGIGLVIVTSFYLFGFNLGLESYTFLTSGELPAQNLRAYTLGLSVAVSFVGAWLATFTTPYFINPTELNWGPKYAYIWFVSGLMSTAFVYFMLPDVKGRSLEEIDEMFRNKVRTRDFKSYVCTEIEEARLRGAMNALGQDKEDQSVGKHVENAAF